MQTIDDIRDVAIRITDKLVGLGYVNDCIDTDDESEFEVQDVIYNEMLKSVATDILCKGSVELTENEKHIVGGYYDTI